MAKSVFTKYITAFILIIFISFAMLFGIITSVVRVYSVDSMEDKLSRTATVVATQVEAKDVVDIGKPANSGLLSMVVYPLVNIDADVDVLITDPSGNVYLTTVHAQQDSKGYKIPIVAGAGNLGTVDFSEFQEVGEEGGAPHFYHGTLSGLLAERSMVYAAPIVTQNVNRGYVLAASSTVREDGLLIVTRRAVITSMLWVMIAAIIATFFITERIIHPLQSMKAAAKNFARGDFSTRVAVIGNDEVSELGRAFNHMAESLDNLEKMRNSFLASVSHDLRTPMTTIAGFIDGINTGAIPPEKHAYYLGVISAEVHRLSRLVGQLLDLSRLESGDRKFNFIHFDVAEVARIVLISFERQINEKHLDVSFETEQDAVPVFGDRDAVHQVLYNLCHNAIKFARDGGKLTVNVVREEPHRVRVTVYDEGQGIAAEELPYIFDRFYKTDKSRGLDKSGVGLGLYICKTIIDAHGEQISASSDGATGCSISFTLKEGEMQKARENR